MLELVDDGHHVEASLMLKTNPAPQIAPNFLKLLLGMINSHQTSNWPT